MRAVLRKLPLGSFESRLRIGAVVRPHYALCMYYAAVEAKMLGYHAVTVIELGVAGGNGLVCLCRHRKAIQEELGIEIVVLGFDMETGLPESEDPRDLLYYWKPGTYEMNRGSLEKTIAGQATLILGDVSKTLEHWNSDPQAPLGAVIFDLDFYTSTMAAFTLFDKSDLLPRVYCYFDDICSAPDGAMTDRIGEREAIRQFNCASQREALQDYLSQAFIFEGMAPEHWHQQIYLYHRLSHPKYNLYVGGRRGNQQDALRLETR